MLNPNSFLYASPTVTSVDDPHLNVQQTYDIVRQSWTYAKSSKKGAKNTKKKAYP